MRELSRALCSRQVVLSEENRRLKLTHRLSELLYREHQSGLSLAESSYQKILLDFSRKLTACGAGAQFKEFEVLLMQESRMQELIALIARGLQQVLRDP